MTTSKVDRERTIRWHDPAETSKAFLSKSGLGGLTAMLAGEILPAPIFIAMGMRLIHVESGLARVAFTPAEWMYNPMGSVHGGILATILDSVLTCCVFSKLPEGKGCTTTDLQVRYIRPLRGDGPEIIAEGRAVHVGNAFATAEADARDASGKLYAHATTGLAIINAADFAPR